MRDIVLTRAAIIHCHQLAVSFVTSMFTIDDALKLIVLVAYSQVASVAHKRVECFFLVFVLVVWCYVV